MKPTASLSMEIATRLRRMEALRLIDVLIIAGLTALVVIQVAAAANHVA
jgi:hypothetical protein